MIIDTAKPVAAVADVNAQYSVAAVTRTLPTHIGNISAYVSSIRQMFPLG
jgi:hypothetical protein